MGKLFYRRCLVITWAVTMQWFVVSGQQLKLGSNPSTINKASLLELESTKQGLLLPRISDTTVATLATAPDGMLVYFTVDSTLLIRKGGHWQMIADLANFWRLGVAAGGDSLSRLQDVALSAPANGQLLQYNGSKWVNLTPSYVSAGSDWLLGGNSVSGIQTLGTTSNFDLPFVTNNAEHMRLSATGFLGIGTTTPSTLLHVFGTNPLTLTGVQTGTSTSADSLLTITSGLVRKLPISTYLSTIDTTNIANFYVKVRSELSAGSGISYNAATGVFSTFASTLTAGSIPFAGAGGLLTQNNPSLFWDAVNNRLGIGTNGPASDFTLLQGVGSVNSRGFRFTGNAISGANTGSGFSIALGYNVSNNKQLWLGDADYLGNVAGTFVRYSSSGGSTILDAIAGDNSVRRPIRIGVGSDPLSSLIFGDDANTAAPGSYVWANGNMAIGNGYRSNSAPSNGLIVQGNVGIGTATPSTLLHVFGTNPLTLTGVQTGTSTSADSLLTITSGLVRKLPMSTFATAVGNWSTIGNSGSSGSTNFLGTTDNVGLHFRTDNTERMYIDSVFGNLAIGTNTFTAAAPEKLLVNAGTTTSFNAIVARGSVDNYFQLNVNNQNSSSGASSDIVATADNGTENINYVDLGMNSSTYNTSSITGGPDNAYLYSTGNDFVIGNTTTGANLILFTGGSANTNEAMRINGSGFLGINKTNPTHRIDIHGTGNLDSTLSAPNYTTTIQTLTSGTITWDQTKGANASVTLTGNSTLSIANAAAGMYGLIKIQQDATGSRTLTLPSGSKVINGGGGAVTLTTTAGAIDVLSYFYDGTNYYWTVGYNYN